VKLSRGILKKGNAPVTGTLRGHERLNRIDCGIDIRLPWWGHTGNRTKDGHFGRQKTHLSDFADVSGCHVVGKDLANNRFNLRPAIHLAPIEPDNMPLLLKQRCEISGVPLIPTIQYLSIARANLDLIRRWRVLRPN
jgi:hypothetical protein